MDWMVLLHGAFEPEFDALPEEVQDERAVLLVAGDKSGGSARRFYAELIRRADARFDAHVSRSTREGKK